MKIQHHISLKKYNSFGVDVSARELIEIEKPKELLTLKDKIEEQEELLFLGEGSNILFTKNFNGLIIKSTNEHIELLEEKEKTILISAGAGLNWDSFVEYCLKQGWYGLENLSLIPGSIGSCPVQNIGAYGIEACDFIEEVFAYDIAKSEFISIPNGKCEFGYRNSIFKKRKELFIYKVKFRLKKKPEVKVSYAALKNYIKELGIDNPSPSDVRNAVIKIRQSKLPDHTLIGNAGSFFKNPILEKDEFTALQKKYPDIPFYSTNEDKIKIPAAWLIEKAGWKGKKHGNAAVHKDQPLVLINLGEAKGLEIADLSEGIRLDINKNFGITLYPEVNIL